MNGGQTIGIPIGPDTSLVVAEVLLAASDQTLAKQCGTAIRGFRYVDDYELAFSTLREAESVLTTLQGILGSFELILNPRKTGIIDLPSELDSRWSIELSRFGLRGKVTAFSQRNDILALFSTAFEHASKVPEDSVLRYAVARVRGVDVDGRGWPAFQNCVLNAASSDPSTLAAVLGTLYLVSARGGHQVSRHALGETFEHIIAQHAPRAQGSEVAWALWGALAWGVSLGAQAARLVSSMDDCVVALLALDAAAKGLFPPGALNITGWVGLVGHPDALTSEYWLLAYEAHRQGWLTCPALPADPAFSSLLANGVGFYDPTLNTPQFPLAAEGLPGGQLPAFYG